MARVRNRPEMTPAERRAWVLLAESRETVTAMDSLVEEPAGG